jgi:hypothetical protein
MYLIKSAASVMLRLLGKATNLRYPPSAAPIPFEQF